MVGTYDESTKSFMNDVSNAPTGVDASTLKQSVNVVRSLLSENPKTSLAKLVAKRGIKALARDTFDKQAAQRPVNVVSIFKNLNEKYGREWFDWEPETVIQTLSHDFGMELDSDGENIVGALQLILNTNQAHENWHIFEKVGHAFNTNNVDFTILQPLRPDEIALTLAIMNYIRPKEVYDTEVAAYIAACAKESGMVYLPDEFFGADAQKFLDGMENDLELKSKVANLWASKTTPTDLGLLIQTKALYEIKDYIQEHL
jgi:hypothetical protein